MEQPTHPTELCRCECNGFFFLTPSSYIKPLRTCTHTDALAQRQMYTHQWQQAVVLDCEWEREKWRRWKRCNYKALKRSVKIFMTWKLLARALSLPGGLEKNEGTGPMPAAAHFFTSASKLLRKTQQQCVLCLRWSRQRSSHTNKSQALWDLPCWQISLHNKTATVWL